MYYVSYITEYPIYEPAEGGYYYAGTHIEECLEFWSWKKANKMFHKLKKEFREMYEWERGHFDEIEHGGCGKYCHPGIYFRSYYIGDGAELTLTRQKPVEHGWHPYC